MKILHIANKAIYPSDGGTLAILNLAKGYAQNNCDVHILNMITHKHSNSIYTKEYDSIKIHGIEINTQLSVIQLLSNILFSNKAYISQRFYKVKFLNKIKDILYKYNFDLIQLEGLYVLQYVQEIRKIYTGKIIYRPHNLEYLIWERNASATKSILKKLYFTILYRRLKKQELNLLNSYDFILPIAKEDAAIFQKLGNSKPLFITPFGIDLLSNEIQPISDQKEIETNINFIGALDWIPNQKGLIWFIENCLPIILKTIPNIKLNIAGRNAPKWLIKKIKHENINYCGEVEHAFQFIQMPGPIIVPLFSGSGMRVKIIESMYLRKAIVATSIAAEGIDCTHKKDIIIADSEISFATSVLNLLNDHQLQIKLGENAYELVKLNYNYSTIAKNALNFIKQQASV